MSYLFCLWLFLFSISQAEAQSHPVLSWDSIGSIQEGESVKINGFLYRTKDNKWILSPEPDLKTCCIGAAHKKDKQLVVEGDIASLLYRVVTLEGIFSRDASTGNYRLIHVRRSVEQSSAFPWATVCTSIGALALSVWGFRCYRNTVEIG